MSAIPRNLLDSIDARWHEPLLRFVDSGEASQEFIDYLDGDMECQRIVDVALSLLTTDLAATARALASPARPPIADIIADQVLQLDRKEREKAMKTIYSRLQPEEQFNHEKWIAGRSAA